MRFLLPLLLISFQAWAATPPPGAVEIKDVSGNVVNTTTSGGQVYLNVAPLGGGSSTVNQGSPNTASNAWPIYLCNSAGSNCLVVNSDGSLNVDAAITGTVTVTGTIAATQSGSWSVGVNNFPSTQAVTQSTSPWVVSTAQLPSSLGQKTMANSTSVTIASDQSAIPITGSITATNSANGNPGSSPPSQATQIAGTDGSDLRVLSTNSSGVLNTNTNITNASVAVTGTFFQAVQPVSQSGIWNLNNISGTISLPTGAATSSNQTNGNQETQIVQGGNTAVVTATGAQKVDGSSVTQPVSGTVTANIGTTNGLQLDTTGAKLNNSQASTTSGQTGPLIQGAVTTSPPSYTTAQTDPLSLDTAGNLRVTGANGTFPATESGTWTVQPGNTPNTTPWLFTINQGGNSAGVAPASTAATAAQPALVVGLSPNSPLPAGTNSIGTVVNGPGTNSIGTVGLNAGTNAIGTVAITPNTSLATYSACYVGLTTQATPTDIFTVTGSATKTVTINKVQISGTQGTVAMRLFNFITRSSADSGGTCVAATTGPLDQNDAAATASAAGCNPSPTTLGTLSAYVGTSEFVIPATTGVDSTWPQVTKWGEPGSGQGVVLRGTSQQFVINMPASATTTTLNLCVNWTEQ